MSKSKTIFIVTYTEDYMLENQWAFTERSDAENKNREMHKMLFEDVFNEHNRKEGSFDDKNTYMDYQSSIDWWDDDCRSMVYIEEVILEGECN